MSSLLLTGQRAVPQRALENGFNFTYPRLAPALNNILTKGKKIL
jgi:NAD dependent epimerase/dehydratase family enzyme